MSKLEAVFDSIKYSAQDMIGLYEAPADSLGGILASAAARYEGNLFTDPALLQHALEEAGASSAQIYQVCLMTQVSGFPELLRQDDRTIQADLDRYIQNAGVETGFNRDTILRLTGDIVFALGGSMSRPSLAEARHSEFSPQTVAIMAQALYEEELRAFQADFDKASAGGSVKLNFNRLEPLANVGIPQAKYLLGSCLLEGLQIQPDVPRGLDLLQEAADMGDSRAAAALGDYYYSLGSSDSLARAYDYYTGYGAAALNTSRRAAVAGILNQKVFNGRLLKLCVLLLAVCALTVLHPPGGEVYSPCTAVGVLALAAQLVMLVGALLRRRTRPYDSLYGLPAAMSGAWFLYMLARLFL